MKDIDVNLKFEVASDNKSILEVNDRNWFEEYDYEAFTTEVFINIYEDIEDTNNFQKIGTLTGRYFKVSSMVNKNISIFDVFDSISQEAYMMYEALTDKKGNFNVDYCGFKSNIFHIERFAIEESYRNQGLGEKILYLLDDVLNYTLNFEVGCYILQPAPIIKNKENDYTYIENEVLSDKLKNKLIEFYNKCGYNIIPNKNFMYLNTDYKI